MRKNQINSEMFDEYNVDCKMAIRCWLTAAWNVSRKKPTIIKWPLYTQPSLPFLLVAEFKVKQKPTYLHLDNINCTKVF